MAIRLSRWPGIVVSIETCHPGGPSFIPYGALFSKKSVSDYVVNVQLTSSLRISERENSQIQELAPRGLFENDCVPLKIKSMVNESKCAINKRYVQ